MELNRHDVNVCIKAHLLPEEQMRNAGFTDWRKDYWYFCRDLGHDISFNVTINKRDIEDLYIVVIDEEFCQPYNYQYYLQCSPDFEFAIKIKDEVEYLMEMLQGKGILSGHIKGEYI